jgi:hypothetical protein
MTNYRRNFIPGSSFFFTVNLADRQSQLLTDHIALLREGISPGTRTTSIPDRSHCCPARTSSHHLDTTTG